ncbi:hypothetical protein D3C71_953490 [compost metagenome]
MINNNYRSTIQNFISVAENDQAHVDRLVEKKNNHYFTDMSQVRGNSNSNIEKMTHPLSQPDDVDYLSPYMIDLLGRMTTLAFAEKVLQSPRKQILDQLGIDDSQQTQRQSRLHSDQIAISRFYNHRPEARLLSLTLNGSPFLEQEPTTPYFIGQKIITPDFTIHRREESTHLLDLLRCKFRDDSGTPFDKAPIERLQKYNSTVHLNESRRNENGASNKADYFVEMAEYLIQRGDPGDFIVQNSLESSSDKNTPHFQYIPNQVPLPIFFHIPPYDETIDTQRVDWHLPSLYQKVDLRQPDWRAKIINLQQSSQQLLNHHHISTTPVFRMVEQSHIEVLLVFKKDGSPVWNMALEDSQHTPGWLEACGIFIANTPKAEVFNLKGAQQYYAIYSVTAECIDDLF